jgi:GT2 family glycosyltransferase
VKRPPTIDASIVVGANERLIFGCLDSLLSSTRDAALSLKVTAICNDPASTVADGLTLKYPEIRVERNAVPRGFAANHNAAIRPTSADYVLVLNDDVVILGNAVEQGLAFLEHPANERVAVLGPRLLNADRSLQPSTYSFPSLPRALFDLAGIRDLVPTSAALFWFARLVGRGGGRSRFWQHDRTCDVDTFRGAFMLVRVAAIREVGLMDETTLAGGEETEWHYRFRQAGWRVVFYPDAEIIHYGRQTTGRDSRIRNEYLKGYLNFFRRHRPRWVFSLFAGSAAAVFLARLPISLLLNDRAGRAQCLRGFRTALRWLWHGAGRARPGQGK